MSEYYRDVLPLCADVAKESKEEGKLFIQTEAFSKLKKIVSYEHIKEMELVYEIARSGKSNDPLHKAIGKRKFKLKEDEFILLAAMEPFQVLCQSCHELMKGSDIVKNSKKKTPSQAEVMEWAPDAAAKGIITKKKYAELSESYMLASVAKNALIVLFMPHAKAAGQEVWFSNNIKEGDSVIDMDDSISEAYILTCSLVEDYSTLKGAKFTTYVYRILNQKLAQWKMRSTSQIVSYSEHEMRNWRLVQVFRTEEAKLYKGIDDEKVKDLISTKPLPDEFIEKFARKIGRGASTARAYDEQWLFHRNSVGGSMSIDDDTMFNRNKPEDRRQPLGEFAEDILKEESAEDVAMENLDAFSSNLLIESLVAESTPVEKMILTCLSQYPYSEAVSEAARALTQEYGELYDKKRVKRIIESVIRLRAFDTISNQMLNPDAVYNGQ